MHELESNKMNLSEETIEEIINTNVSMGLSEDIIRKIIDTSIKEEASINSLILSNEGRLDIIKDELRELNNIWQ